MNHYFYALNARLDRSVIDENYTNYVLSRKLYAKDLPIVTVSEADGYLIKGSLQLRHVELQGDENFVAVGRDFGERMVHYIFKALKHDNGYLKMEHFVCAAEYINVNNSPGYHPWNWINSQYTEQTGIQYPYVVPDDLCVYIFAKTPKVVTEKYGFQVLNENSQVVFDSRQKYLDIICFGNGPDSQDELDLLNTHKIAVGSAYSSIDEVPTSPHYLVNTGGVIFEKGYTAPNGKIFPNVRVGAGARLLAPVVQGPPYFSDFGRGSPIYVIDVNGF